MTNQDQLARKRIIKNLQRQGDLKGKGKGEGKKKRTTM
jgi:hypothetical protein